MKIAIEAQRIFRKNKHGMDMVVLETVRCLQKLDKENEYWIFTAPGEDVCLEETPNFHIEVLKSGFYPLWEQVLLPLAVRRIKPDVLHCTSNTAPLFPGAPLVLTLHDVIFLEKKTARNASTYQNLGRIYSRFIVPKVLGRCRRIITVSEYEKRRIAEVTRVPQSKITVNYNGYSTRFNPEAATADRDYIFFLGAPNPKKNTPGTLKAYALYLQKSTKKLRLKIADYSAEMLKETLQGIGHPEISDYIDTPGYIPQSELPATYGHAATFLYTSLRESFGIPQLEAMACGTPVVVSNTSALPEIAGEGAVLVDPLDPQQIADALLKLEEDEEFREAAVAYGYERVKLFTWENTARKALEIYGSEA